MKRLELERLDDRILPSAYVWTGNAADYNFGEASNFTINGVIATTVPGANNNAGNDTVEIPDSRTWCPIVSTSTTISRLILDSGTGVNDTFQVDGCVLTLAGSTNADWSGGLIWLTHGGSINVSGGNLTDTTTNINGWAHGEMVKVTNGADFTFANPATLAIDVVIDVEGSPSTIHLNNSGSIQFDRDETNSFVAKSGGSIDCDINNSSGVTLKYSTNYAPIDLQANMVITPANATYGFAEPLFVDGTNAYCSIQSYDTLSFNGGTSTTTYRSVFQVGGQVILNPGATLASTLGIRIDGGDMVCQGMPGSAGNGWSIQCPAGDFMQNGGNLWVGGWNTNARGFYDAGQLNMTLSTSGAGYGWYAGKMSFGMTTSPGPTPYESQLLVNTNFFLYRAGAFSSFPETLSTPGAAAVQAWCGNVPPWVCISLVSAGCTFSASYNYNVLYPLPHYGSGSSAWINGNSEWQIS